MKATRIELQKSLVVQRRNLLKKFAKAWGERDIDAVMAYMTSNCVYEASVDLSLEPHFRGQIRRDAEFYRCLPTMREVRLEFPICS